MRAACKRGRSPRSAAEHSWNGHSCRDATSWGLAALRSIVWFGSALLWAYLKTPTGATLWFLRNDAIGWLGFVLLIGGGALHVWSNLTLARAEAGSLSAPVTGGPYRYVRNPIYVAGGLILLGVYLCHAELRQADIVAAVALMTALHILVVRREEPALRRRFGSAYEEYCHLVPRWIPRLQAPHIRPPKDQSADNC